MARYTKAVNAIRSTLKNTLEGAVKKGKKIRSALDGPTIFEKEKHLMLGKEAIGKSFIERPWRRAADEAASLGVDFTSGTTNNHVWRFEAKNGVGPMYKGGEVEKLDWLVTPAPSPAQKELISKNPDLRFGFRTVGDLKRTLDQGKKLYGGIEGFRKHLDSIGIMLKRMDANDLKNTGDMSVLFKPKVKKL